MTKDTGKRSGEVWAKLLDEVASLERLSQEALSRLSQGTQQATLNQQLDRLERHSARTQSIVEHWDALLAQAKGLKPLVMAPARLAQRLTGRLHRRALLPGPVDATVARTPAVLFMPTNGVGLGHMARCLAIARRMRQLSPETDIIFLTTSPALHLAHRQGIIVHHMPPYSEKTFTSRQAWNQLLAQRLAEIDRLHRPSTLVFDGVWLYQGLIDHLERSPGLKSFWLHTANPNPPPRQEALPDRHYFNLIVWLTGPGFNRQEKLSVAPAYTTVDPIVYFEPHELPHRREARHQLGLPEEATVVLVSLGAGVINHIFGDLDALLQVIEGMPGVYAVIAETPIVSRRIVSHHSRTMVLRDFPLCRYFNAFDAAVTAAGYNTVYEMLRLGVPAVLLPNMGAPTNAQLTRARAAEQAGGAICLETPDRDSLARALSTMLEPETNQKMRQAGMAAITGNGAEKTARLILGREASPQA